MSIPMKRVSCPDCDTGDATCPKCNGCGTILTQREGRFPCPICNSTGLIKCPTCHGNGYILNFSD